MVEAIAFSHAAADVTLLAQVNGSEQPNSNAELNGDSGRGSSVGDGGLFVVTGGRDKTIRVWSVSTGACVMTLQVRFNPLLLRRGIGLYACDVCRLERVLCSCRCVMSP